jgi:hypothetical protein
MECCEYVARNLLPKRAPESCSIPYFKIRLVARDKHITLSWLTTFNDEEKKVLQHLRQIVNKTEETQRGVQKSVCALSRLPLYGHIQVCVAACNRTLSLHTDYVVLYLLYTYLDIVRVVIGIEH